MVKLSYFETALVPPVGFGRKWMLLFTHYQTSNFQAIFLPWSLFSCCNTVMFHLNIRSVRMHRVVLIVASCSVGLWCDKGYLIYSIKKHTLIYWALLQGLLGKIQHFFFSMPSCATSRCLPLPDINSHPGDWFPDPPIGGRLCIQLYGGDSGRACLAVIMERKTCRKANFLLMRP